MSLIERLDELAAIVGAGDEEREIPFPDHIADVLYRSSVRVTADEVSFVCRLAKAWPQIRRVLEAARRSHNGMLPRGELREALAALEVTA